MTVVNHARPDARTVASRRRLAVSWTVAASAMCPGESSTTASLAEGQLVLDASETEDGVWRASARLELGDRRLPLFNELRAAGKVTDLGDAIQLELMPADAGRGVPLLAAVFRGDQAVYVRSALPAIARLGGGTYDPPAGTLRAIPGP